MKGGRTLAVYAILYLAFLYAPIALLPVFAFNDSTIIAFPLQGFTTNWFSELTTIEALHSSVWNSLYIAVCTSVIATSLGICASRAATRYRFPAKGGIMGMIMLPLVLPEIIVAVSLLVVIVNLFGLGLSRWTVIAAHTLICTPFCIAILNSAFQNLDASLEEAAVDLGETPFSTFRLITLPLGDAGDHRVPSDILHDLAGRIHHRVLPDGDGADPAGLHLGALTVPAAAAGGDGAWDDPCGLVDPASDRGGVFPAAGRGAGRERRQRRVPVMENRKPIITIRGVQKYYGTYHALRGIDMEIGEGEFFSLLGPSGCGKTTLLRTIAGFEDVSDGVVELDGKNMEGVPANRRPTNMVFQSYAIFPHLTVAENVGFGLRRKPMDAAEKARAVGEALEMVGLGGYGDRAAHALSGGQRQRVALARALILKPRVLLLDEPLSALDKKMREQMQVELMRLQRAVGITFILVTHDQEEALIMSDRIAVMFEGGIAQLDDPEVLYRRPNSRAVAEFIGVMNFLPGTAAAGADGGLAVEVAGLGRAELAADQCAAAAGGGAVSIGIRPETMTVLYDGEETDRRIAEGVVDEVVYYGDMTYYDVRLDGVEAPVTISMKNYVDKPVLDVGARTRVAWDWRSLVAFPG